MKKVHRNAFSLVEISIVILIIGVLIAAVGQGVELLHDARLSAARMITQGSKVNSINGVILWLETTSEKSFDSSEAQDGSIITNWYDINPQSTVKNNAKQPSGTASLHPTYKDNCINNLPCVNFNGTSNYITTTADNGVGTQMSIFLVSKVTGESDGTVLFSSAPSLTLSVQNSDAHSSFLVSYSAGASGIGYSDIGSILERTKLINVIDNNTSATLYINRTAMDTESMSGTTQRPFGLLNIGAEPGSTYFTGDIAELIIFNGALNKRDRTKVEDYLVKKWKIQ